MWDRFLGCHKSRRMQCGGGEGGKLAVVKADEFKIWRVQTTRHLCNITNFPQMTALEWVPDSVEGWEGKAERKRRFTKKPALR